MPGAREAFGAPGGGWEARREGPQSTHAVAAMVRGTRCGVLAGGAGGADRAASGESQRGLWRALRPAHAGGPRAETRRRLWRALDPAACRAVGVACGRPRRPAAGARWRARDGQTARRRQDGAGHPLHLLCACATEAWLGLAHRPTEEQSNARTARPAWLRRRDGRSATGALDAMGCPRTRAAGAKRRAGSAGPVRQARHTACGGAPALRATAGRRALPPRRGSRHRPRTPRAAPR